MHLLEMAFVAFMKAKTLKIVREGSQVWLSNDDGFPLNLKTGEIERRVELRDIIAARDRRR